MRWCISGQQHFGDPSRGRYHNRQWGAKMKAVGLHPSNTGKPGGRETGQQKSDYIIEGGPFVRALDALLARGFRLTWGEIKVKQRAKPSGSACSSFVNVVGVAVGMLFMHP